MDPRFVEALKLANLAVGDEEFHREDADRLARLVLELGNGVLEQQQRALTFITVTLDGMQARPLMWGGKEAVELQYTELLTLWVFLHTASGSTQEAMQAARQRVSSEYQKLSRDLLGEYNARPLSARGVTLDVMLETLVSLRKRLLQPV